VHIDVKMVILDTITDKTGTDGFILLFLHGIC